MEFERRQPGPPLELAQQVLELGSGAPPLAGLRWARLLGAVEQLDELRERLALPAITLALGFVVGDEGLGGLELGLGELELLVGVVELGLQPRDLGLERLDGAGLDALELPTQALVLPAQGLLAGEQLVEARAGIDAGLRTTGRIAHAALVELILQAGDAICGLLELLEHRLALDRLEIASALGLTQLEAQGREFVVVTGRARPCLRARARTRAQTSGRRQLDPGHALARQARADDRDEHLDARVLAAEGVVDLDLRRRLVLALALALTLEHRAEVIEADHGRAREPVDPAVAEQLLDQLSQLLVAAIFVGPAREREHHAARGVLLDALAQDLEEGLELRLRRIIEVHERDLPALVAGDLRRFVDGDEHGAATLAGKAGGASIVMQGDPHPLAAALAGEQAREQLGERTLDASVQRRLELTITDDPISAAPQLFEELVACCPTTLVAHCGRVIPGAFAQSNCPAKRRAKRDRAHPLLGIERGAKHPGSGPMLIQPKLRGKIESLAERHEELGEMICAPEVMADKQRFLALSREHAELTPVALTFARLREFERELDGARELLEDPDMRELAEADIDELEHRIEQTVVELTRLLTPKDPNDSKNVILEIRAGPGGDEAGLFVADLWRMYGRFAERHKLTIDQVEFSENSAGGFKEISGRVAGRDAYARLKFERGVHRVQRVPATESQGRIHTSTATVAVMPEAEEIDIHIDPSDIEFEAMRSGGSGGQHVNTTDSAVRLTHKPTGVAVRCDQEKSQFKNRDLAMIRLRSKLLEVEIEKAESARAASRREQIGTGDRSEKIRTYNYPQDRITDHRVSVTRHNLAGFMDGDIDDLLAALRQDEEAARMSELA